MAKYVFADNGKMYDLDSIAFAEKVMETRRTKGAWATIDLLVDYWHKHYAEESADIQDVIREYKETLQDKVFGQTKDGKDFERRFTMSFPQTLLLLIRTQYKAQDLPFDRKFIKKFLKRYPSFRVANKD